MRAGPGFYGPDSDHASPRPGLPVRWWDDMGLTGAVVCRLCGCLVFVTVDAQDVHQAVCPGRADNNYSVKLESDSE